MKNMNLEQEFLNEDIRMLISERIGQIYRKIKKDKIIKKIQKEVEKQEEYIENFFKNSIDNGFDMYCKWEEARSQYEDEILKKIYTEGIRDGVRFIIYNIK